MENKPNETVIPVPSVRFDSLTHYHRCGVCLLLYRNNSLRTVGATMSTRANVKITDGSQTIWLYRHSDGYPSATGIDVAEFCMGYVTEKMRTDPMQSAGWLIVRGNLELNKDGRSSYASWKVGHYEPTDQKHGDIEWLYTIDLDRMEFIVQESNGETERRTVKFQITKDGLNEAIEWCNHG